MAGMSCDRHSHSKEEEGVCLFVRFPHVQDWVKTTKPLYLQGSFSLGMISFRKVRRSVPGAFRVGYLSKDCFQHPCNQLLLCELELISPIA